MDINTTANDDLRMILDTVARLVERHIPPEELRRRDRDHVPPFDLMPALGAAGLLGLPFPAEYGGQALPWSVVTRVEERFGYRAAMLGTLFDTTVPNLTSADLGDASSSFAGGLAAGDIIRASGFYEASS